MVIKTDLFSHLNEWFPKHHYGTWEKGQAKKSLFIQLVSLRAKHFVGFSSFLQVLPVLEESETIYIYIYGFFFKTEPIKMSHSYENPEIAKNNTIPYAPLRNALTNSNAF